MSSQLGVAYLGDLTLGAVDAALPTGAGASTGSATSAGVGISTARAAGALASGSATSTGVAPSPAGAAAGAATSAAVGTARARAVGSSTSSLTAVAVGSSIGTPGLRLYIAGTNRTAYLHPTSLNYRRAVNDRSTMSAELIERAGTWRPAVGSQIIVEEVFEDGSFVRRFGGYIEAVKEQAVPGNLGNIKYAIRCTDYSRLLDWRLYAGSFEAGTAFSTVVQTIHGAKLAADGITLGDIPTGPALTARVNDGLRPVTEWFRKLSTDTGNVFRIDENRVLQFGPLATSPLNPSPFDLTWGSRNWRDLTIDRDMGDYRNRQYVRTEYTTTGDLTNSQVCDGVTRDFFQFDGPFQSVPTVTLNGTPLTVGRFGPDPAGFDCYYDVEGWGIHFVEVFGNPAPAAGATLEFSGYRVRFNNYTMVEDAAQIAIRAAAQGDSGVIEAIHEDRYIDTTAALQSRANGLLRQFGSIPTAIEFTTDTRIEPLSADIGPGQSIAIDLTGGPSDVDDTFMVEAVESTWQPHRTSGVWIQKIKVTDREPYGQATVTPIERLAEAVRIGPDQGTVATESPIPVPTAQITTVRVALNYSMTGTPAMLTGTIPGSAVLARDGTLTKARIRFPDNYKPVGNAVKVAVLKNDVNVLAVSPPGYLEFAPSDTGNVEETAFADDSYTAGDIYTFELAVAASNAQNGVVELEITH